MGQAQGRSRLLPGREADRAVNDSETVARAARNIIMQVAARLHQEQGMTEGDVIRFVSEAAYDYFDVAWDIREMTEYPSE